MFGVGVFKDGVGFTAECISGASCVPAVSVEVPHVVFEICVCQEYSVALCADLEEALYIEC